MKNQGKIKKINSLLLRKDKSIFWLFIFSILLFIISNCSMLYKEHNLTNSIKKLQDDLSKVTLDKSLLEIQYTKNIDKKIINKNQIALIIDNDIEYLSISSIQLGFKK